MKDSTIAIVGMAGRFPGAHGIGEFWRNLRDGVESIRTLSEEELLAAGVSRETLSQDNYVKVAAILDGVDLFDASFFGLSPKDAAIMDPQHRHFLECAWEAIESSGYTPEGFSGSIGVFAGCGYNAYMIQNLIRNRRLRESAGMFLLRQTGNDKDVLATRVSYQLNLHGPSLSIQTACSTSLVSVHMACQSLLNFECDMALAGGVTIEIPHGHGYLYQEGEILSKDGHCRAFDADASGTVFSSGVGIVVLRRLEDAIEDGDTIHAVILGSAVNNDGQRKVGYFAPSVAGQAEVIAQALEAAGVTPEQISYVETHGTGTAVGDPLEIRGLTQAFRQVTDRKGYCALGSLKPNVGHLDAAAGVAGLIKTVLALEHGQVPASLNFRQPNPQINFNKIQFYVNTTLTDWKANGAPRRAGITSLGIGGTNAHVVLEEAPEQKRSETTKRYQLIPLSAKTETALEQAAERLASHLRQNPQTRLGDVAFTYQVGRKASPHRRTVVASDPLEAAKILSSPQSARFSAGSCARPGQSSVVFLFSGQGAQYLNMGSGLYASEPVFRCYLDRCAELLIPHLGLDLREILYPSDEHTAATASQLNETSVTQPALFSLEYSLAQWWMAHGVSPKAMAGHSLGEYVAACLAGVFSLEEGLALTAVRGRLMEQCPHGSMMAVSLPHREVPLLRDLSIAAINSPEQCVVSGPVDSVAELEQRLTAQGIACRILPVTRAFHSSMLDPILESFLQAVQRISLCPPRIPFLSNVTGGWISAEEAIDPRYWVSQLRDTVRFADCTAELLHESGRLLIEVGPGQTLTSLVRQNAGPENPLRVFSSLRRRDDPVPDPSFLLDTVGQLWIAGLAVDWSALHQGEDVRRIPLPTYPFQRQRFWIEPDLEAASRSAEPLEQPARSPASRTHPHSRTTDNGSVKGTVNENGIDDWFYERKWKHSQRPSLAGVEPTCWILFQDSIGLGKQIAVQLRGAGHKIVEVFPGDRYRRSGRRKFMVRPGVRADYDALLADLIRQKLTPRKITHLWSINSESSRPELDDQLDRVFYSLLFLAQALGAQDLTDVDIAVVSDRQHSVTGEPITDPVAATLLGPVQVIPKELPGITCRSIDIDLDSQGTAQMAVDISAEHSAPLSNPVVAIRAAQRWTYDLDRTDILPSNGHNRIKSKGVYLITGGLGDLGLVIAEDLARQFQARLVLLGRTPLPPAEEWKNVLDATGTPPRLRQKIRKLLEIESLGGEVLCLPCDVCRRDDLKQSIERAIARFGSIDGVIHAAGVLDDGPLQLKPRESAKKVLAPKVQGTLALVDVLEEMAPGKSPESQVDFIALFSSVSSVLAPSGQVDYVAANAFMDAFAASRPRSNVIAINWGPWLDTGMAARGSSTHPLLGRRLIHNSDEVVYSTTLSLEQRWILADHRLKAGPGVLSGTSYLEMACVALLDDSFDEGVELKDVFFHTPLLVEPGSSREARTRLHSPRTGTFQFSIRARDDEWVEYASGTVARLRQQPPPDQEISTIAGRCQAHLLRFDDHKRTEQERFFDFGPRWRCLKAIHLGQGEALAEIELPNPYKEDALEYHLHPALLDLATGAALYLIEQYGQSESVYLPMSYSRARVFRSLPAAFFCHIRSRQRNEAGHDVATFDLTLLDEQGKVFAEIEGFSMRLIRDPENGLRVSRDPLPTRAASVDGFDDWTLRGITPADGVKALTRILASGVSPQVFVLPDGLGAQARSTQTLVKPISNSRSPKDDVQSVLAEWWHELLGVECIGLDDDFFELGGHSLIVVRLYSKINKKYGTNLSLSTLFEARTVRKLADLIRQARSPNQVELKPVKAIVTIQSKGTRPPLFVVAGLTGNVIEYARMASYLGEDQPIFGLVPRSLDDPEPYHTRVEDMASYYVEAIRTVQPEGPYRLVGHSFGGTVAYEVTQQLMAQGSVVSLLGLFDTIEWHYREEAKKLLVLRERLSLYVSELKLAVINREPFGPFWLRANRKALRIVSPICAAIGVPLRDFPTTLEQVHERAGECYQPRIYPARLTLFRSTARRTQDGSDEFLGWGALVAGGIEAHHVPSDHYTIIQEPAVRILSEKLRRCLDRDNSPCDRGTLSTVQSASQDNSVNFVEPSFR
jgi:acyl transferase domain-containing protein